MDNPVVIVLAVVGGTLLVALIWLIATYNRFVRLRQHITESWSDIDVELKRRHDLIPNLVATVKGYAAHERAVFEEIAELRSKAMAPHASASDTAADETALGRAVARLVAVAEAYPALKADANFLALQKELSHTEDRIAAARRFYNGNVRELNQLCATVPTNLVASAFGFTPAPFFEIAGDAERAVPRVGT